MIQGSNTWIADGAKVYGDVTLGKEVGIWFNAVIRAESDRVTVGDYTNIQDNAVVHEEPGMPVTIGNYCTIGHGAIIHGCTIGDNTLIGMGAIVMNRAVIGKNCLIAAGALITEGTVIPDGSLVIGMPGKVKRELTPEEIRHNTDGAIRYAEEKEHYAK